MIGLRRRKEFSILLARDGWTWLLLLLQRTFLGSLSSTLARSLAFLQDVKTGTAKRAWLPPSDRGPFLAYTFPRTPFSSSLTLQRRIERRLPGRVFESGRTPFSSVRKGSCRLLLRTVMQHVPACPRLSAPSLGSFRERSSVAHERYVSYVQVRHSSPHH